MSAILCDGWCSFFWFNLQPHDTLPCPARRLAMRWRLPEHPMEYLSAFWDNHSTYGGFAHITLGWKLSSFKTILKGEKVTAEPAMDLAFPAFHKEQICEAWNGTLPRYLCHIGPNKVLFVAKFFAVRSNICPPTNWYGWHNWDNSNWAIYLPELKLFKVR